MDCVSILSKSFLQNYLGGDFVYLESDQIVSVIYNGGTAMTLHPFEVNGLTQPAVFFIAGAATSLTVTNSGTVTANIFFAENPQTVVKNVPIAIGINASSIAQGQRAKVDLFSEIKSSAMVIAFVF